MCVHQAYSGNLNEQIHYAPQESERMQCYPRNRGENCANREKTVHLTLFTMGEIFIIFSIFSDICYFLQIYEK